MFHSYFVVLVLFFFLALGWPFFPSPLASWGPPQCLNSGPGSDPGVNEGWGLCFGSMVVIYFFFHFLFRCLLDLFPFNRLKATHCLEQYFFLETFLCVVSHREPLPLLAPCLLLVASRPGLADFALLRFYDASLVHWGFRVPLHWRPARGSAFQRSPSDEFGSIFPASPGSSLHHVLLARWGGLFYWSGQVAGHPLRLACVFSVSYVSRCVKLSSFPKIKGTSLGRLGRIFSRPLLLAFKTLKRFSGKVISFSLAIPGSKLFVREVFKAVSRQGHSWHL